MNDVMSLMNMNGHYGTTPFAGTEMLKMIKDNYIFLANESIIFHYTEPKCVEHYNFVLEAVPWHVKLKRKKVKAINAIRCPCYGSNKSDLRKTWNEEYWINGVCRMVNQSIIYLFRVYPNNVFPQNHIVSL